MTFYHSKSILTYIISFDCQSNLVKCILSFIRKGNRATKGSRSLGELISDRAESISSGNSQGWTLVLPFKHLSARDLGMSSKTDTYKVVRKRKLQHFG